MDAASSSRTGRTISVPRVFGAVAVLSAVISAAGFTLLVSPAQSTPEYMSAFNAKYNTRGAKVDSCLTCHTKQEGGAENINPYGADFGKNNHDFGAVEGLDSDGDGFTNVDEIKADRFPGDAADNPNSPPPTTTTTAPPTTTTTRPFPFSLLPESLPTGQK